jgi:hypothetical protein
MCTDKGFIHHLGCASWLAYHVPLGTHTLGVARNYIVLCPKFFSSSRVENRADIFLDEFSHEVVDTGDSTYGRPYRPFELDEWWSDLSVDSTQATEAKVKYHIEKVIVYPAIFTDEWQRIWPFDERVETTDPVYKESA